LTFLAADEVDESSLRLLDDRLRADVPGSEGWVNDPAEFRDRTYDERLFDPATHLVAVDDVHRQFAGLVRVWANATRSRLALLGVTRPYRRRGLARALLGATFATLYERGVSEVMAEVDGANAAGLALVTSLHPVETGASLVLRRSLHVG
jgi:ribosomal protein S18 acetylase RimI-like enzyme